MRIAWIATLLGTLTMGYALGQGTTKSVPVSVACFELNQTVMTQVATGRLTEAELAVSAALGNGGDDAQNSCAGIVLNNMAAWIAVSGRLADAERLAEQAVRILEKAYSANDVVLLRPLQTLAAASFEQGKTGRAREAFKRMQAIPIQRPEDRALVHGIAGALLEAEGKRADAETEYLAALRAWDEAGRGETADAAAILNNLASLYIHEQRLVEARQALDRAFAVFNRAKDAVPIDRIKVLDVRGVLQARQGDWQGAEHDLHDALSMADREPWMDPVALRSLLVNYALVLRRNHRPREARSIEARAAAIRIDRTASAIVDITELLPKAKPAKK